MQEPLIDVMLIEDNEAFRNTLATVINQSTKLSCQHAYASAEDALQAMENEDVAPNIVLLDIGLTGMNGIQCIPHLKRRSPASKIIMLTIHDDDDNIFQAICSGASGYLLKDSPGHNIIDSIQDVLRGGAPMNAHIAQKVLDMFKRLTVAPGDYNLTNREKEILKLLVEGLSKKQIAQKLFLSYHTVDTHIRNIYAKLEVHTRSGAVAKALKEKLL